MPINKSESTHIVKVDFKGLRGELREQAQQEIMELLIERINAKLDSSNSPVAGGPFKKRKKDGSQSILELTGSMRDNIEARPHPSGVKVGIFKDAPEVERLKSYNHNVGDTLPARQFVPAPDGEFKGDIKRSIDAIVNRKLKERDGEDRGAS